MLNLLLALCLHAPAAEPPKAPAPAVEAPRPVDPPRLSVAPAGRLNLGSLGPVEIKTQTYTFTNTSEAPISLRLLDMAPGVTVSGPALQGPIAPKGSATLTMRIDPTDWVGPQKRNVRLSTDDSRQGDYLLPVGFVVRPDLSVDKDRKSWGAFAPHESPALAFTFTRETGTPTQINLQGSLPPHLELEQEPLKAPAEGQSAQELRFILRPDKLEPGVRRGLEVLKLATNAPHQKEFTLYADWQLKMPVEAEPQRVIFLAPKESQQSLVLKAAEGKPFVLKAARIEGQGFRLGPLPTKPGTEQRVSIRRIATKSTRTLLVLDIEGLERPLKVPLAYLPPELPASK